MADDDDKILRRYRELPREEPPRHLDDAILAAARRAVHTHPAPLVVPSGRQRWYFPLAAAAIIVLAVAVTMHIEREQPAEEAVLSTAPSPREMAREEFALKGESQKPAPQPERQRKAAPAAGSRELRAAAPAPQALPAPAAPPVPAPSQDSVSNSTSGAVAGRVETPQATVQAAPPPPRPDEMRRESSALAKLASRPPEQWLQGIAELRKQGRHDEADRELAEFRKRHPDYKIPEAMLEKVEKR